MIFYKSVHEWTAGPLVYGLSETCIVHLDSEVQLLERACSTGTWHWCFPGELYQTLWFPLNQWSMAESHPSLQPCHNECFSLVALNYHPLASSSLSHDRRINGGWRLIHASSETYVKQANHIISNSCMTHSEKSTNCPLQHTWYHRCLRLTSVIVIDRKEKVMSSLPLRDLSQFCSFSYWP